MTKELEKRLKLMRRFNQSLGSNKSIYNDKVFVHDNIMYATDGFIFVVAANLTDRKDFSFFRCSSKLFEYLDSSFPGVKKIREELRDGEKLERILQPLNCASVSFDIDFEGYSIPAKLCSGWSKRRVDKIKINLQTEEAVIDFRGGSDIPEDAAGTYEGVTGTYGDIIKNVSGTIPESPLKFDLWHFMEIMKQCKVKKLRVESYPDRNVSTCKVGDYTFFLYTYYKY